MTNSGRIVLGVDWQRYGFPEQFDLVRNGKLVGGLAETETRRLNLNVRSSKRC